MRPRLALFNLLLCATAWPGCTAAVATIDAATPDAGAPDATAQVRLGITLPGDELYPVGIAVGKDGTFYVGSVREGLVVKAAPGTFRAKPFIPAGSNGLVGVWGLFVDDATGTLWVCSNDLTGARLYGTARPALKSFDAVTGAAKGSYDLPGGGFCYDVALDRRGDIYVTDYELGRPRLLRLPKGGPALEVWFEGADLKGRPAGMVIDDRDRLYFVEQTAGELFRIGIQADGRPALPEKIALPTKLNFPAGLKLLDQGTLLVVQSSWWVSRIVVTESAGTLTGTVANVARVRRPTTVALFDGAAWVVEGQLANLTTDAGPPELPFAVFRVEPLR